MAEEVVTNEGGDQNGQVSLSGTVTVTEPAPPKGTPEHAEYLKKMGAPQGGDPTSSVSPMPEGGVEKFYNKTTGAYDWANHVKELNYRLQQGKQPKQEPPKQEPPQSAEGAQQKPPQSSSVDWTGLENKIRDSGSLEVGDYEALEKAGIPRSMVDNYMQALAIARQAVTNEVISYAGGQDELNGLIKWASANLSAEEKQATNAVLRSDQWRIAVNDLKARRAKTLGTAEEPNLIGGGNAQPGSGGAGFSTPEEMSAAINARDDKGRRKYDVDPAYRKSVRDKIAATKFDPTRPFQY